MSFPSRTAFVFLSPVRGGLWTLLKAEHRPGVYTQKSHHVLQTAFSNKPPWAATKSPCCYQHSWANSIAYVTWSLTKARRFKDKAKTTSLTPAILRKQKTNKKKKTNPTKQKNPNLMARLRKEPPALAVGPHRFCWCPSELDRVEMAMA